MQNYRVSLKLRSASGSAWYADTIFGHLCWQMVWRYGETRLHEWLARYQVGEPPLLLSDGFPGDLLPRPLLLPSVGELAGSKQEGVRLAQSRKKLKKIEWLTRDEFERVRAGETFRLLGEGQKQVASPTVTFKNQISRLTGTTGEEGQLYSFVGHPWETVTIYLRIADGELDTTRQLFDDLRATGYGKRKSVGYGEIESYKWQEFDGFKQIEGVNAFVSLSHFVPAQNDPIDGRWKINVKYGKLGGEWATTKPFKRPLVMLEPGSWFRTDMQRDWYGRLVSGVSADRPEVVQYGLAFAVPMRVQG